MAIIMTAVVVIAPLYSRVPYFCLCTGINTLLLFVCPEEWSASVVGGVHGVCEGKPRQVILQRQHVRHRVVFPHIHLGKGSFHAPLSVPAVADAQPVGNARDIQNLSSQLTTTEMTA